MEEITSKAPRVHQKLNSDDLFFLLKKTDQNIPKSVNREMYGCDCQGRYCDGFPVSMNPVLIAKIDALEKRLKKPIQVIVGVRCADRNIEADGSRYSFHLLGRAADIRCETISIDALAESAEALGLLVIRDYQDEVVHCQWNN